MMTGCFLLFFFLELMRDKPRVCTHFDTRMYVRVYWICGITRCAVFVDCKWGFILKLDVFIKKVIIIIAVFYVLFYEWLNSCRYT